MVVQAALAEIRASPQLPRYVAELDQALAEERRRRRAFYQTVREDEKAEFINGEVIVHSPAEKQHTHTLGYIYRLLSTYADHHNLGWVGLEKVMISLTRNDYEPDLVFFGTDKAAALKARQNRFPAPDLVIEVLSPSTAERDRGVKFADCAAHGVEECWIVDAERKVIEQYTLRGEQYELKLKSDKGELRSVAVKGLRFPIRAAFEQTENVKALKAIVNG